MHYPCAHLGSVQSFLTILIMASGLWFVAMLVYFEAGVPCQVQALVYSRCRRTSYKRNYKTENPYRKPQRSVFFLISV